MWAKLIKFIMDQIGVTKLILGTVIFAVASLAVWHYNNLINDNAQLRSDKLSLEHSVEIQKQTIDKFSTSIDNWAESQKNLIEVVNKMQKANEDANAQLRTLTKIYAKHNLSDLSSKRPKLIEDIINRGTDDTISLLSCTSGTGDCSNGHKTTGQNPATPKPTSNSNTTN